MNFRLSLLRLFLVTSVGAVFFLYRAPHEYKGIHFRSHLPLNEMEEEEGEERSRFTEERLLHELKMLRNPVTGTIPEDQRTLELAVASRIPEKGRTGDPFLSNITGTTDITVANNYQNLGPNNIAGRSRTLAIDRTNPNHLLSGGTTGGIFRSLDRGATWTFVSPENDIRSATSIAQDPITPTTWYCGTGEVYYPVSTAATASTFGHGIYKSTNNGATWTKLPSTVGTDEHRFDNKFDLVHRIAVHPVTGHVYAAVFNRIVRSTDGGLTWTDVLGNVNTGTVLGSLTEVVIASNGSRIFAAFTGENSSRAFAGVWESTTGDLNAWRRIAGGPAGSVDSVAGWRPYGEWGRVVLALNSANNRLHVLYKNGDTAAAPNPKPEADLFRCDFSSGNPATYVWNNLSAYVPDEPNNNIEGIDPYTTQFNGFNMSIAVKPDNDNILFIGGVNIHRVHLDQSDPARRFRRIGGYGRGFFPQPQNFFYPNHHPDVHGIYFPPNSADILFTASDGGVHETSTSVLADTVRWTPRVTNLQTLQYQFVNINPVPEPNRDFIIGGAQDNGTLVNLNVNNTDPVSSQQHSQALTGDGASTAISTFTKSGNLWRQHWYMSLVNGTIYRFDITLNTGTNNLDVNTANDITPNGLGGSGQWRTIFVNDPDSTEHLYYNNRNRLFRTTTASTASSVEGWTELTGTGNNIPSGDEFTAMRISKSRNGAKYLFIGTDAGKVYRLNDPHSAAPSAVPVAITPALMTANSYVADISINPRNPDTVLVVVSNYDAASSTVNNVFWTGNATAAAPTWQVLDGALAPLSSQSCEIVLTNTGVEYYVGTSVGLYSTTAINGNNTAWLNEGGGLMKRAIIRSLVNRQRDNTLVVGTHGNGAFLARIGRAVNLDVVTALPAPITNDRRFIRSVYPVARTVSQYEIGNLAGIRKISVVLYDDKGRLLYRNERAYQNGQADLGRYAAGIYFLHITSEDGRYRHIQKIVRP